MTSKPVKQVIIFSENYGHEVQEEANKWLANPAHRIYETDIRTFGADHYMTIVIIYWEAQNE